MKNKVLIVDDHDVVVTGLRSAIQECTAFKVVDVACSGEEAVNKNLLHRPDIVVMDILMPDNDGIWAAASIKKSRPEVSIIIFSMYLEKENLYNLFKIGISGYILKESPLAELIHALEMVSKGGTYFSETLISTLSCHLRELDAETKNTQCIERLSAREQEVLRLLADGLTVKDTASQLFISPKTVESHKYNIMEKLNVKTVADLTKIAIKKKLVDLN